MQRFRRESMIRRGSSPAPHLAKIPAAVELAQLNAEAGQESVFTSTPPPVADPIPDQDPETSTPNETHEETEMSTEAEPVHLDISAEPEIPYHKGLSHQRTTQREIMIS
ncbi:unnamed protein product [Choristocarpus tenellus]